MFQLPIVVVHNVCNKLCAFIVLRRLITFEFATSESNLVKSNTDSKGSMISYYFHFKKHLVNKEVHKLKVLRYYELPRLTTAVKKSSSWNISTKRYLILERQKGNPWKKWCVGRKLLQTCRNKSVNLILYLMASPVFQFMLNSKIKTQYQYVHKSKCYSIINDTQQITCKGPI